MLGRLEPLLPALDNAPVFLAVAALLLLVAVLAGSSLYQATVAGGVTWRLRTLKGITAACTCLVLGFWIVVGAGLGVFAGGVGGSLLFAALSAGSGIFALALLGTVLVAWARQRRWADWALITIIGSTLVGLLAYQRLWVCEPLAWSGWVPAQMCTADLYARGEQGAIRSVGAAAGWYGQAALRGSEEAVYALLEVTPNKIRQRELLEAASAAGNGVAMYQLYLLVGPEEGLPWLQKAIQMRHPDALFEQSRLTRSGQYGYPRNSEQSLALLEQAAELGSSAAAAALALAYERGDKEVGHSRDQSLHWEDAVHARWPGRAKFERELRSHRDLRDRATAGDADAMLRLARDFEQRARSDADYAAQAERWMAKAANAGATKAQFELAFRYFRKPNTNANALADARRWLRAAADQGDHYAMSNLAHYLSNGQYGFEIDLAQAQHYASALVARLAAAGAEDSRDYRYAEQRLARIEQMLAAERAWRDGLDSLQSRAAAGDAGAKYLLFEKHGQDRERGDWTRAQAMLEEAAELGHVEARYRVAFQTLSQPRTPQAEARAYAWMQDAAERGHRGAMVFMARVHTRGLPKYGIDKNLNAARVLYERALEGLEGDVVYARKSGSTTVATRREQVEKALADLAAATSPGT